MIKYRYDLYKDIQRQLYCWQDRRWIKDQNIVYFAPNLFRAIKIWLNLPKPTYQCEDEITCYWVTGGTWGGYQLPNEIYVCPYLSPYDVEDIIKHEITHLKHESEVQDMTYQEKENYINNLPG